MPPAPPLSRDVPTWIAQLASADAETRASAARKLFLEGCKQSEAAISSWRTDAEFISLLTGTRTVGLAVQRENFERIRHANASPPLSEIPSDQNVREFEIALGSEIRLDILTSRQPDAGGAIVRFLDRFGEGVQQIEYEVRSVGQAMEILCGRFGVEPLYPEPRPGANGTRVNFFLIPAAANRKVLIELVELPRESRRR